MSLEQVRVDAFQKVVRNAIIVIENLQVPDREIVRIVLFVHLAVYFNVHVYAVQKINFRKDCGENIALTYFSSSIFKVEFWIFE